MSNEKGLLCVRFDNKTQIETLKIAIGTTLARETRPIKTRT